MIVAFVYQVSRKNEAIKFLHAINDFDMKARALDVKLNIESGRKWVMKLMSIIAFCIVCVSLGTSLIFGLGFHYGGSYSIPLHYGFVLCYLTMMILQFSFATLVLKSRFCLLNDSLRFTFLNTPLHRSTRINVNNIGKVDQLPTLITDLYGILFDCVDTINDSFTFQLIPYTIYYLMANLFAVYSMLREVLFQSAKMYIAVGTNVWWVVLHTGIMTIPLYSSYTTTRCALKTPIIVSGIVKSHETRGSYCVINVFKSFLLELQFRNVFFENEFFRIDWKLLFSVSRSERWRKFLIELTLISDDFNDHNFSCYNLSV